jgi:hypothetical protein
MGVSGRHGIPSGFRRRHRHLTVFQSSGELEIDPDNLSAPPMGNGLPMEAWIDGKTGLPVMTNDGITRRAYLFQELPPAPLPLPARFLAALQQYQETAARAAAR